jgi:ubiquinol-cytochrome c reductase cytochrome c subunit
VTGKSSENNPGGFSLGRIGPVTEGLVAFLGLLFAVILSAMWIVAKQHGKTTR